MSLYGLQKVTILLLFLGLKCINVIKALFFNIIDNFYFYFVFRLVET